MGDFNEVHYESERFGSIFHRNLANIFNNFIFQTGLVDNPLGGYSFTWSDKSAGEMSKPDRFLILEGLLSLFPNLSGLIPDRHILDHRLILFKEVCVNYGPITFQLFHS